MSNFEVKTFLDLKRVLDNLLMKGFVFRGINDKKQLLPKILRQSVDCSKKEFDILSLFEQYYGLYASANNCWEFLSIAQHYGLMTRLIDFSQNPYVALFFALHSRRTEKGAYQIYAIDSKKLTTIYNAVEKTKVIGETLVIESTYYDAGTNFSEMLKTELGKLENNCVYSVKPNFRNPRIFAQQGLFIVPSVLDETLIMKGFNEQFDVINIPDDLREEALEYLSGIGFDEFHLMPDLASVCFEINFKALGN